MTDTRVGGCFGFLILLAGAFGLLPNLGCAVPQPRGLGEMERIVEPTTRRGYWRYLPEDYVNAEEGTRGARRWPLVVSFHGMKPFDSARPQALEWQQEADRFGFIVIAPELRAPDVLRQFPLREVTSAFKSDEQATLAILDHVFETTHADPSNVLSTSWSSGGYMAHYMLNQHPGRFTCLAVRQSNFSLEVMEAGKVSLSRDHPILIISTQNDFAGVKRETREAIQWYEKHGFERFGWVVMRSLGHERTPDVAADFFARAAGVRPNRPPAVLVKRQAIDGNPAGLAMLAGNLDRAQAPLAASSGARETEEPRVARRPTAPRPRPRTSTGGSGEPAAERTRVATRTNERRRPRNLRSPLRIRVSSAIGFEPLMLAYSADCPVDWHRTADFLWTLDGDPIGNGVNGQKTISDVGEHTLGLLVVTRGGEEHRSYRLIRVLPRVERTRSSAPPVSRDDGAVDRAVFRKASEK